MSNKWKRPYNSLSHVLKGNLRYLESSKGQSSHHMKAWDHPEKAHPLHGTTSAPEPQSPDEHACGHTSPESQSYCTRDRASRSLATLQRLLLNKYWSSILGKSLESHDPSAQGAVVQVVRDAHITHDQLLLLLPPCVYILVSSKLLKEPKGWYSVRIILSLTIAKQCDNMFAS